MLVSHARTTKWALKDGKANPPANFIVEHRDVPHPHQSKRTAKITKMPLPEIWRQVTHMDKTLQELTVSRRNHQVFPWRASRFAGTEIMESIKIVEGAEKLPVVVSRNIAEVALWIPPEVQHGAHANFPT